MAPKRGRTFGGNHGNTKRKKFNLISIRQSDDFRKYGEAHPADDKDKPIKYTQVKDTSRVRTRKKRDVPSSSESEEEAPAIQQLLKVMGVNEEEQPESELEDPSEEEEGDDDSEENDDSAEEILADENEDGSDVLNSDDDEVEEEKNVNGKDFFDNGAEEEDDDDFEDDDDDDEKDDDEEEEKNCSKTSITERTTQMVDKKIESPDSKKLRKKARVIEDSSDGENNMDINEANQKGAKSKPNKTDGKKRLKKGRKLLDISSDEEDKIPAEANTEDDKSDPFSIHFEKEVEAEEFLEKNEVWMKMKQKVPGLGNGVYMYKSTDFLRETKTSTDLKQAHVKHKLCERLAQTNTEYTDVDLKKGESLSSFQHNLFDVLNTYQDLLYPKQTVGNTEEIRLVYCLHAVNHVLKTRSRIMAHNTKLKRVNRKSDDEDVEYRDQGLTRPKVVILLPYREKAKKVVNIIIHLLSASERLKAGNYNRFIEEFSETEERRICGRRYKAEDYLKMFEGNVDDNFRVGLSISKMNVKLYAPFYASDIILASPLGLRTLIGDPGNPERDFEFLSSIEMLIMDQSDVFMMQNWDHVLHSLRHFHLRPKKSHDVDFSRVRMWAIDGLMKYFRQTIVFSSVLLPEMKSVFSKHCHNYCGKIMVEKIEKVGSVQSCLSDVPQIFHRVPCSLPDGTSQRNAKLEYFRKKILPLHTSSGMLRTVIYCNYFSFVMLRNLLREESAFFTFIHEYDTEKDIKKYRVKFRKLNSPFMLYTERLHFHYRFRMRGVYHLVWFDIPQYPIFYPELINLLDVTKQACTTTCLFTKYEGQKLMEIVGQRNAIHMLNSEKNVNMITVS